MDLNVNNLYLKVLKGDVAAFKEFYFEWNPRLVAFCRGLVCDEDKAKDLVQDSFLEVWNRRRAIKKPEALTSYLFTVVRNRCRKYLSSGHSSISLDALKECEIEYFIGSDGHFEELWKEDAVAKIRKALGTLSNQSQQIVQMRTERDMTNKEIAAELGLSVRTVENVYYRAIKSLKNLI